MRFFSESASCVSIHVLQIGKQCGWNDEPWPVRQSLWSANDESHGTHTMHRSAIFFEVRLFPWHVACHGDSPVKGNPVFHRLRSYREIVHFLKFSLFSRMFVSDLRTEVSVINKRQRSAQEKLQIAFDWLALFITVVSLSAFRKEIRWTSQRGRVLSRLRLLFLVGRSRWEQCNICLIVEKLKKFFLNVIHILS